MNTEKRARLPFAPRRLLWISFWFLFIASPFIGLLGPLAVEPFLTRPRSFYDSKQGLAYVAMTFGSAFAAGTALAVLRDATFSIASAIRYACAICTCYISVAAVMVIMANR